MSERLLLIRHGESEIRYKGRYIGKTDATLSEDGEKQAAALAAPLADFKDIVYLSSPLCRARRTAELAITQNITIEYDEDIREIDFGLWEGLTFAEIASGWPADVAKWAGMGEDFTFPGGERTSAFRRRVARAAERIIACPAETTAVFSHGGVIRFLICHFLGLPQNAYLSFETGQASLSEISIFEGRGVLIRLNDRHHLRQSGGIPPDVG
jgi:broad specificity phosphatase PhoE